MRPLPVVLSGCIAVAAVVAGCGSAPGGLPAADPAVGPTAAVAAARTAPAGIRRIWVDPKRGRAGAPGTRSRPLRSVNAAWQRIPADQPLTRPVEIQLRKGVYPVTNTPNYWENRRGTAAAPIVLNAVDGARTAVFRGDINAFNVSHLEVRGVAIVRRGDTFHCERCTSVTLRNVRFDGRGAAHETVKVNQSDHITITGSTITGSYENAIDFVAVQHATISNNRISGAEDWCAYVKGGSAYVSVIGNRISDCGTGGFTAGQGTGVEYLVAPWLRYETYGVTVMDNVITDTEGAGLGVNGGYNTVMANNTMVRVGRRSHGIEFVHGSRSCDGEIDRCRANSAAGAWGGVGVDGQYIPSRHTYFLNNVLVNPPGYRSEWQHFQIADPVEPPAGSGVPAPARVTDDLVIAGNVISNGGPDMELGVAGALADQLRADNRINTLAPDFVDLAAGDLRPGPNLRGLPGAPLPPMTWDDAGVPPGTAPTVDPNRPPGALR